MVEKAWMARHHYDSERRLLVPKVGGARWGSTQEYNEDGTLTYLDWWVRDVKMEDLEASPSTFVEVIVDEEEAISSDARGSLDAQAPIQTNAVEDESIETDIFSAPEAQTISADPFPFPNQFLTAIRNQLTPSPQLRFRILKPSRNLPNRKFLLRSVGNSLLKT